MPMIESKNQNDKSLHNVLHNSLHH